MIDMVRKHTVEGTGNHRQICAMLDRCKTMMHEAKTVSRTFVCPLVSYHQSLNLNDMQVPPANHREKVPLGSSSASMYPGYSPADHVYGQAAMQYGSAAARAKAEGIELKPEVDIEYEIGQGKGIKRKKLAEMRAAKGSQDGSGSASGSGTDAPAAVANGRRVKVDAEDAKSAEEANGEAQPSFYIDTNPTPVNLPFSQKKVDKRASPDVEATEEKTLKKAKKAHEGDLPAAPPAGKLETEDISAEVDARMKEKEEKRRKKEEKKRKKEAEVQAQAAKASEETSTDEKKRKRESEGSSAVLMDATAELGEEKKPKKKKSKKEKGEKEDMKDAEADGTENKRELNGEEVKEESKKRSREEGDAEGKKKKKRKKGEDGTVEA